MSMPTTAEVLAGQSQPSTSALVPRIALIGVHGFGAHHLANLDRFEKSGELKLVAVADPSPPEACRLADSVAVFGTLDELLAAGTSPDVVIIATPIQTHAP